MPLPPTVVPPTKKNKNYAIQISSHSPPTDPTRVTGVGGEDTVGAALALVGVAAAVEVGVVGGAGAGVVVPPVTPRWRCSPPRGFFTRLGIPWCCLCSCSNEIKRNRR